MICTLIENATFSRFSIFTQSPSGAALAVLACLAGDSRSAILWNDVMFHGGSVAPPPDTLASRPDAASDVEWNVVADWHKTWRSAPKWPPDAKSQRCKAVVLCTSCGGAESQIY